MMVPMVLVGFASAVAVAAVRRFAVRKAMLDVPNERSSHKVPVPRLGGAAFVPVVCVGAAMLLPRESMPTAVLAAFGAGAALLYVVSLVDDIYSLSTTVRFVFQFGAAGLLLWAAAAEMPREAGFWGGDLRGWAGIVVAAGLAVWIVGLINIYNFMDGIDGIAGLQAVVGGLAWAAVGYAQGLVVAPGIGCVVAAGAAGFLALNWPPAKIFMGDAGSTVLGFVFAGLPILAVVERGSGPAAPMWLATGVLVVWPFLADGTFTILRRLGRGENILTAHRSHLYQRLVIAGVAHRTVTLVFSGLAALGAAVAIWVHLDAKTGLTVGAAVVAGCFWALWRAVGWIERKSGPVRPSR